MTAETTETLGTTMPAVAVTGLGLVNAGGDETAACWRSLGAPASPPAPLGRFPLPGICEPPSREVPGWEPARYWGRRRAAYLTRSAQFALRASEECIGALDDAERRELGVVVGTHLASVHHFGELLAEPDFMTPLKFLATLPSSTPTNVSIACGFTGVSTAVSSPVAGLEAVTYGADLVRDGYHDAVLAGGAEELSPELYAGCARAGLTANGRRRPRGPASLVLGEGAAMLLLERADRARAQGRQPLAVVAGWAATHAPPGTGAAAEAAGRAVGGALADAGVEPAAVDLLVTGGAGPRRHRRRVARAVAAALAGRAVPTIAPADWWGESLGASGATAVAVAAGALAGRVPLAGVPRPECVVVHDAGWDGSHAAIVLVAGRRLEDRSQPGAADGAAGDGPPPPPAGRRESPSPPAER